ncbi:hypothetical protein AAG570_002432 [Ranatra chinensis]|uniref:GRIP domain-containing protein n=1 Tax=Ranatra chinensis TaxID=642074 RepID=A0ABD0Y7X9_9HEMI
MEGEWILLGLPGNAGTLISLSAYVSLFTFFFVWLLCLHNNISAGRSPLAVSTSLSDSGHFEELSPHPSPRISHSALEKEIDRLKHQHEEEALKLSSNAQVDILVQRLAEANDRYYELKPQLEAVQAKVSKLEKEKEELLKKNKESEEKHKNMYLQMFNKGQQAAIFQVDDSSNDGGPILTLPDLLKQLEVTKQELESVKDREFWQAENLLSGKEAVSLWNMCRKTMYRRMLENKKSKSEQDAEVTLQFLKSAVYYFLTDRENVAGHLAAIQSILGFSQDEKLSIERASYAWK